MLNSWKLIIWHLKTIKSVLWKPNKIASKSVNPVEIPDNSNSPDASFCVNSKEFQDERDDNLVYYKKADNIYCISKLELSNYSSVRATDHSDFKLSCA